MTMTRPRVAAALAAVLAVALLAPPAASAQEDGAELPRRADGRPDLSGTYDTATLTPLQRPERFGDRLTLTPEEAATVAADPFALRAFFNIAPSGSDERGGNFNAEAGDPNREAPPAGGDGSAGAAGMSVATTRSGSTAAPASSSSTASGGRRSSPTRRTGGGRR